MDIYKSRKRKYKSSKQPNIARRSSKAKNYKLVLRLRPDKLVL